MHLDRYGFVGSWRIQWFGRGQAAYIREEAMYAHAVRASSASQPLNEQIDNNEGT